MFTALVNEAVHVVDCNHGHDSSPGTAEFPFRTVAHAQRQIRQQRQQRPELRKQTAIVNIQGLCELDAPLSLTASDSNTRYVGSPGAILSAGTTLTHRCFR